MGILLYMDQRSHCNGSADLYIHIYEDAAFGSHNASLFHDYPYFAKGGTQGYEVDVSAGIFRTLHLFYRRILWFENHRFGYSFGCNNCHNSHFYNDHGQVVIQRISIPTQCSRYNCRCFGNSPFVWNGTISSEKYYGILFLFLAVAGAVGYSSICKRLTSTYNAITITTWQFLVGAILFFIPFMIWGLPQWRPEYLSFDVLKSVIALAVLCSSLSFVLYTKAIEGLGMTRASIFSAMIPAVSAVVAYFMGQESFTTMQIFALAIAISGVVLSQLRKSLKTV